MTGENYFAPCNFMPEEDSVPAPYDLNPRFNDYAHPERLVSTEWLAEHLDYPGLRILECNEDGLLYDIGHVPGALRLDWRKDLFDPNIRDFINGQHFASLMRHLGIRQNDTIVLYGDKSNWWAAYALWVFSLFGHADVRLLDGGRDAWFLEERPTSFAVRTYPESDYPIVERHDDNRRVYRQDVLAALGSSLIIDARSRDEYVGNTLSPHLSSAVSRRGHIPTAVNNPRNRAVGPDSRFLPRTTLEDIYDGVCSPDDERDVITYCTMGEQASHTWFVLTYLLGCDCAYNYDGSWSEWGTAVRMPIVQGTAPGSVPFPLPLSARH